MTPLDMVCDENETFCDDASLKVPLNCRSDGSKENVWLIPLKSWPPLMLTGRYTKSRYEALTFPMDMEKSD